MPWRKICRGLLLALVQGLSDVSPDVSDSFGISFTGQGRFLQPSHHFSRKKGVQQVAELCHVDIPSWERTQGRG